MKRIIYSLIAGVLSLSQITACKTTSIEDPTYPECCCMAPPTLEGMPIFLQEYVQKGHRWFLIANHQTTSFRLGFYRARGIAEIVPAVFPPILYSQHDAVAELPPLQSGIELGPESWVIVDAEPIYAKLAPYTSQQIFVIDELTLANLGTIQENPVKPRGAGTIRNVGGRAQMPGIIVAQPKQITVGQVFTIDLYLDPSFKAMRLNHLPEGAVNFLWEVPGLRILSVTGQNILSMHSGMYVIVRNTNPAPYDPSPRSYRKVRVELIADPDVSHPKVPLRLFEGTTCNVEMDPNFLGDCTVQDYIRRILLIDQEVH